jgi:outer membrane protein TolC
MARAGQRTKAAQERLNALMSDLVPTGVGDPFQQQTLEAGRAKARQELQDAEREFELAEDAFTEFEEGARRKGVPPGWLEER